MCAFVHVCVYVCVHADGCTHSLQPVLEAVGVYRDRPFNEVALSLHTLVREALSLQPCSLLSIPSHHSLTTPATPNALQSQLSGTNALLKGENYRRSIWEPNSRGFKLTFYAINWSSRSRWCTQQ